MKVRGMKSKSSPIHQATSLQREVIHEEIERERRAGASIVEIQHAPWIGAGCAADRGGILVCSDGKIAAIVYPDGIVG
jgi:hypothetical protein